MIMKNSKQIAPLDTANLPRVGASQGLPNGVTRYMASDDEAEAVRRTNPDWAMVLRDHAFTYDRGRYTDQLPTLHGYVCEDGSKVFVKHAGPRWDRTNPATGKPYGVRNPAKPLIRVMLPRGA